MIYQIRRSPIFLRDVEDFGKYCSAYSREFVEEQFERLTFAVETLIAEAPGLGPILYIRESRIALTCFVSVSGRVFGSSIRSTRKREQSTSSVFGARRAIHDALQSEAGHHTADFHPILALGTADPTVF